MHISDVSLLKYCTDFLDPFGRFIGVDGVIIMAFILGFPANETVIPIIIMSYMASGTLVDYSSYDQLFQLLSMNGWTITTAVCTIILCILHYPCSTTCLTIKKETATGAYAASTEGPGSKHAPLLLALMVALVIGALAQKSRMCFAGSIRDVILMKNFDLLSIIAALFAVMTIYNIATGNFHLSFSGQPIAHSQHLWNILGMYVVGFAAVLAGGCPLRQLILAGQGSSDSAVTFLGMLLGAAFAHNFNLVGSAAKAATATDAAVPGGPAMPGKIAVIVCIVLLFVIAATNLRRKKAAK